VYVEEWTADSDVELVWTGTEYGVAWKAFSDPQTRSIYFARFTPSGVKIGSDVLLTSGLAPAARFSLAWTGVEYALAWGGDDYQIRMARFDLAGNRIGQNIQVTQSSGNAVMPSVAWNGQSFGIAFYDTEGGASLDFRRVGCHCVDADADGTTSCSDCDDTRADVHPGASEVCNGRDDDCNGLIDEGLGFTSCGIGACRSTASSCFHGLAQTCAPYAPTPESWNGLDDDCNALVDDMPSRSVVLHFSDPGLLDWEHDAGFDGFNVYRGSLAILRSEGTYTQDPATTPGAARACGVAEASFGDADAPASGEVFFYVVTGLRGGVETDLGIDGAGDVRPNTHPCP
jgi:hypothetical protein